MLNSAVEKFDDIPVVAKQSISALKKLSVRLVRVQQEEITREASGEEDGSTSEIREVQTVAGVLSLPIDANDSIQSLESKLRAMLAALRSPAEGSAAEAETEEEARPVVTVNDWYPTYIPLYNAISEQIMSSFYDRQNLPRIPVAKDAQLSFFPIEIDTVIVDHKLS